MNRMFRAGLLALPLVLAVGPAARANDRPGLAGTRWGCHQYGCGSFCFNLFPHITSHGPLVNYGPYTGYYPFAPYGPWDENLRYHPPGGDGDCGGRGCGRSGCRRCGAGGGLGGLFHRHGDGGSTGSWGGYSLATLRNVGHRVSPFAHGKPACSTCAP